MDSYFVNGDNGCNMYGGGRYVKWKREENEDVILVDSGGSLGGCVGGF